MTELEAIWEKAREFNAKSHIYSEVADELIKLAQQIEERVNDENRS